MRYTKTALLTFGAGLLLALIVVAADLVRFQRVASAAMALGIAAIPIGMIVDWRLATRTPRRSPKGRSKPRMRRASPAARRRARPRKPVGPKSR
jgi:hypothetical protein